MNITELPNAEHHYILHDQRFFQYLVEFICECECKDTIEQYHKDLRKHLPEVEEELTTLHNKSVIEDLIEDIKD